MVTAEGKKRDKASIQPRCRLHILSFSRMIQTRGWRWELQQRGRGSAVAASTPGSSPPRCSGSVDVPAPAPYGRDSPPHASELRRQTQLSSLGGKCSSPFCRCRAAEGRHLNQVRTLPRSSRPGLCAVRKSRHNLGSSSTVDLEGKSSEALACRHHLLPSSEPPHHSCRAPSARGPAPSGLPCSVLVGPLHADTSDGCLFQSSFPPRPKKWALMHGRGKSPSSCHCTEMPIPPEHQEKLPRRARLLRGGISGRELSRRAARGSQMDGPHRAPFPSRVSYLPL